MHPALLIVFSNLTRSPSFRLPANCAAIQTHDDVQLERLARPGDTVNISWQVVDTYTRREPPLSSHGDPRCRRRRPDCSDPKNHEHVHGRRVSRRLLKIELAS